MDCWKDHGPLKTERQHQKVLGRLKTIFLYARTREAMFIGFADVVDGLASVGNANHHPRWQAVHPAVVDADHS